ncbi:hypothetical protein ACO1DJ_12200 [Staphylococcus epidermidis]|uniref:hypothetical protein n=1 Tax=Staphylococcus epidermidis TaxID=1282 RepID=UPI003BF6F44C
MGQYDLNQNNKYQEQANNNNTTTQNNDQQQTSQSTNNPKFENNTQSQNQTETLPETGEATNFWINYNDSSRSISNRFFIYIKTYK